MLTQFEKQFASTWPPEAWQDLPVLVAISGGADSVALLRTLTAICVRRPPRLIVAHFNHQWRGDKSIADAQFVANLAQEMGHRCELGASDVENQPSGTNPKQTEEAARKERYAFLLKVAEEQGARFVATAHTADDQAETVLQRILRGTGIGGLAGIPRLRVLSPAVTLVRPLLGFRRHEIEAYLSELGQVFCEDSSNRDTTYTRNRIRHELIPLLAADYNQDVSGALLRLAELANEHQRFLSAHVEELDRTCICQENETRIVFDTRRLEGAAPLLVREFLISVWKRKEWPRQAMGLAEWKAIQTLATGEGSATITLPGGIVCRRDGGRLTLQSPR